MTPFYITLILIASGLIGYLFGSISNGIIIGKILYDKDPRDYGSHNSGGTNVGRTFGLKVGLITIALDIIKTIIPIWTVYFILTKTSLNQFNVVEFGYLICALGSILGHCFPIWHHFKGGKAVSSFGGIVLATSWVLAIIGVSAFIIIVLVSKKVSLGSILGSFGTALLSFLLLLLPSWFMNFQMVPSLYYSFAMIIYSCILIIRHRQNIVRLIHHEERELPIGKNKKSK